MEQGKVAKNMSWEMVNINKLCRPRQWKTLSMEKLTKEGYPVYGANGKIGFYNEFSHEHPTLAITCRGATCGSVHITEPKSYINGNAMALDNISDKIDIKFLYYFFLQRGFNDVISGSAQPQITGEGLSKIQIPLPPLPIQKRIAELLDAADALRRKDEALLKKYDELAQSIFIDMFGDPVKNEKGWDVKKLGAVSNMKAGNFISASEINSDFDNNLYPCYGGNGLRGYVKSFTHDGKYILIGRQGALCGNVKITTGKFHATEHAVVCSPKIEYNVLWFYYLLGALNLNQYASGAAQPGLNVSTLVDIELIFVPLKLQNQFAEKLELIDNQKSNMKGNLINTNQLFNSLIQKAFKGELIN
jgi:type I restriction enzyme S subunit